MHISIAWEVHFVLYGTYLLPVITNLLPMCTTTITTYITPACTLLLIPPGGAIILPVIVVDTYLLAGHAMCYCGGFWVRFFMCGGAVVKLMRIVLWAWAQGAASTSFVPRNSHMQKR